MKDKLSYKKLKKAIKVFELDETASLKEIKNKFYKLSHKWHPDKCKENKEICRKKMQEIKEAYDILIEYCTNYKYSFTEDEIKKHLSYEELWNLKYGDDPLFGGGKNE